MIICTFHSIMAGDGLARPRSRRVGPASGHPNTLEALNLAYSAFFAVTGGGGFLGSHLVDYLMARGDHVRATLFLAPSPCAVPLPAV